MPLCRIAYRPNAYTNNQLVAASYDCHSHPHTAQNITTNNLWWNDSSSQSNSVLPPRWLMWKIRLVSSTNNDDDEGSDTDSISGGGRKHRSVVLSQSQWRCASCRAGTLCSALQCNGWRRLLGLDTMMMTTTDDRLRRILEIGSLSRPACMYTRRGDRQGYVHFWWRMAGG